MPARVVHVRRDDLDVSEDVIRVRRGVVDVGDGRVVKEPKSAAGRRDVHIPPHLATVPPVSAAEGKRAAG
jgi:hypothetical protein